jgi:Domain of unknown function (DUF6894)
MNGQNLPDESGINFAGVKEAREEATRTASDLLRGDELWSAPDWTMRDEEAPPCLR